jgi:hypothetical protein
MIPLDEAAPGVAGRDRFRQPKSLRRRVGLLRYDTSRIFWLCGGVYDRGNPLSDYFARLPRHVAWTCDPSGENERQQLKKAGFNVRQGINAKAFGINLVARWLRSGRLKIVRSLCASLCSEAPRYRYARARDGFLESEEPANEFNHGIDAKRYLFSREPPPPPLALPPLPRPARDGPPQYDKNLASTKLFNSSQMAAKSLPWPRASTRGALASQTD